MGKNEGKAQSLDSDSVEALFTALESPLLVYAHRLLGTLDMAEDVVQDAFLRLHTRFHEVRQPRSWLYRTVHNLALNHKRAARKVVSLAGSDSDTLREDRDPPDPKPLPDEEIARWEKVGQVRLGLQRLDERSRRLIELKFREDLSYKEISARTGLKTGHVGYILHHALKTLAAELSKSDAV